MAVVLPESTSPMSHFDEEVVLDSSIDQTIFTFWVGTIPPLKIPFLCVHVSVSEWVHVQNCSELESLFVSIVEE